MSQQIYLELMDHLMLLFTWYNGQLLPSKDDGVGYSLKQDVR